MDRVLSEMKNIQSRVEIPTFLKAVGLNKRMAEIGVRFGFNLESLVRADPELLVGIDHWRDTGVASEQDTGLDQSRLDDIYKDVFKRFLTEPNVKLLRCGSVDAAKMFPVCWFDYVYIDADHTKAGALRDMNLWWSKVCHGGIIAGHDYAKIDSRVGTPFGVIEAVAEFMEKHKVTKECLHTTSNGVYKSWMIYKTTGED